MPVPTKRPQGPKAADVKRKSGKPIINWLQRKLTGSVRTRRPDVAARAPPSAGGASLKEMHSVHDTHGRRRALSNEVSLNAYSDGEADVASTRKSSVAAISMWSRSNPLEADEDASIRPLPPTSPPSRSPSPSPSPSPSRSSSSYLSDPRTFKSIAASTKPTTLVSVDITTGPNGMAHIAQVPPTPTTPATPTPGSNAGQGPNPVHRFPPHIRTSSTLTSGGGASITFSALPPSPQSSRPSSLNPTRGGSVSGPASPGIQAPQHTAHHPRNNPRPSSPPLDNASVLTLASSAFAAAPGTRSGPYSWTWSGGGGSTGGGAGGDSVSHLGGGDSTSHIVLDDGLLAEDRDASMRALRPRSSRRGSWDSETSGWSARVSGAGLAGAVTRDRSVRTAPSFRTGGQVDDQDGSVFVTDVDAASAGAEGEEQDDMERDEEKDEGHALPLHVGEVPSMVAGDANASAEGELDAEHVAPDMTPRKEKRVISLGDEGSVIAGLEGARGR